MCVDENAEVTKIATRMLLVGYVERAFNFGYQQLIDGKKRNTQMELFAHLRFSNHRN